MNDPWRKRIAGDVLSEELTACPLAGSDTPETLTDCSRRLSGLSILHWPEDIERTIALDLAPLRAAHTAAREEWRSRKGEIIKALHEGLGQLKGNCYKPELLKAAAADWERLLFPEDPVPVLRLKLAKLDLLGTERLEKGTKNGCVAPRDSFFRLAQVLLDARATASSAVTANRLALLKALLEDGCAAVRRRKRERRLVAFDDMLVQFVPAPEPHQSATARARGLPDALRERFPAALIDEFQDTDPLQFAIFRAIYFGHGAPLFFVGDPKQAIHSFRNAGTLATYLSARRHADAECTLLHKLAARTCSARSTRCSRSTGAHSCCRGWTTTRSRSAASRAASSTIAPKSARPCTYRHYPPRTARG